MRPRTLAVLCCIALGACSDDPPAGGNRAGAVETKVETGPLVSRNPRAEAGGMALLLEGPNVLSRPSALGIAEIWAAQLDRSGFPSYQIVHLPPRRIEVRLWGLRDPARARNALRAAYGNPLDMRLIQERAFP